MKRFSGARFGLGSCLVAFCLFTHSAGAQTPLDRARVFQRNGQVTEARAAVADFLSASPQEAAQLLAAAELLDLTASPSRKEAYRRVVDAAPSSPEAARARRRLALLDLQAGDVTAAEESFKAYRSATGAEGEWPQGAPARTSQVGYVEIPGLLMGFQRMAALRPETSPDDLITALARNVVMFGYEYSHRHLKLMPSEYLKLLRAYVRQARELQTMAGSEGVIRVADCGSAGPLLRVLGYRLRGRGCAEGAQAAVEADETARAFLTVNSGFPLVQLEETIQGLHPFDLQLRPTRVPVMFGPQAWARPGVDWLDAMLEDQALARVYLALSRMQGRTAEALYQAGGVEKLKPYSAVLDFFGVMLRIEDGRVAVPGGAMAAESWRQLAGANPDNPASFILSLVEKDDGWLAAYYDALARLKPAQQRYFTDPARLGRYYRALRAKNTTPGPARPIFRSTAQLLLITQRLRFDSAGRPHLPGGLAAWTSLLQMRMRPVKGRAKDAPRPAASPDDVMEALFARVRESDENGLVNIFLACNEIDRLRGKPLSADTVMLLAAQYSRYSQHYSLFAAWPQVGDQAIQKMIEQFEAISRIRDPLLRADTIGSFQAVLSLWEIVSRQNQLADSQVERGLSELLATFENVDNSIELVDAARKSIRVLLAMTPDSPGAVQERMLALLAAPAGLPGDLHPLREDFVLRMRQALADQRLLPLDTLITLADQMENARSARPGEEFIRLASRLKELNLPNPFPSAVEKNAAFIGHWVERHIEAERDLDLAEIARKENPDKIARERGKLAPHFRDTLVGLVYAYYAPPGSMLLHNSPLFVRSHDFLGASGQGTGNEIWGPGRVSGLGWPWSGGGRFVGSLSGIAYALADAEKDFLVPQKTQALIWGELAPQVMLSSVLPRWWRVSPRTQHWVALNLRLGRDLVSEAAVSADARRLLFESLVPMEPRRREMIESRLNEARVADALRLITPVELYRLAQTATAARGAGDAASPAIARRASPAAAAIEQMARQFPDDVSERAVSSAFGTPHPKVARSYRPELLELPLFPALLGYSSRLLAESWESGNLFWAELADEMGLHPAELNRLAPQLTRRSLEHIFANHLEDWPALLAAMQTAGDEFRKRDSGGPVTASIPMSPTQ